MKPTFLNGSQNIGLGAKELAKNWKVLLLFGFLLLSVFIVGVRGVDFGIDFKGGSLFQIEFSEPVEEVSERTSITQTIQQRIDWTGLLDTTVSFFGDRFVIVQVAETDPETIERIESLLPENEMSVRNKMMYEKAQIVEVIEEPKVTVVVKPKPFSYASVVSGQEPPKKIMKDASTSMEGFEIRYKPYPAKKKKTNLLKMMNLDDLFSS